MGVKKKISAEEITAYRKIVENHAKLYQDKREKRNGLVKRLQSGAPQEAGKFQLKLDKSNAIDWQASFKKLLASVASSKAERSKLQAASLQSAPRITLRVTKA